MVVISVPSQPDWRERERAGGARQEGGKVTLGRETGRRVGIRAAMGVGVGQFRVVFVKIKYLHVVCVFTAWNGFASEVQQFKSSCIDS